MLAFFRFTVLLLAGLLASAAVAQAPVAQAPVAQARLNVLLITADDLGMQLNCYGDQTVPTPNLDALANRSVRFTTAYVAQASCSSSRSAMLTGIYPHTNGQYGLANAGVGFRVPSETIASSIPNVLKQQGYRTGVIGKLHVNPEAEFAFDVRHKEGFGNRDIRKQVDFAKSFWTKSADHPWFLMFNVFDPHVVGRKNKNSPAFPDVVDGIPASPIGPADVTVWPWQGVDTPVMRKRIAGYYNCVQRVDAAIGMLMQSLEATGQRDRTLVIFLGDHGPPFSRGKTTCYEAGLRVPFLLDWPGVSQPHVSQKLISAVDIAPTVFDATGVDVPAGVQGASMRKVAKENTNAPWRQTLVGEFHFHGAGSFYPTRAITDGRYKLIHRLPGRVGKPIVSVDGDPSSRELAKLPAEHPSHTVYARLQTPPIDEFYDLEADPHEFENLDGQASVADAQSRLKNALESWQAEMDDPFRDETFSARVAGKYIGVNNDRIGKAVKMVQRVVAEDVIPGASLVIADKTSIRFADAFGVVDLKDRRPFQTDTICWIASLTKPVTAAAAMTLVEAGKLDLDAPVATYLPQFQSMQTADGVSHPVLVRHLMSHSSGIPSSVPNRPSYFFNQGWFDQSLASVADSIAGTTLEFEPGTQTSYCNAAPYVLGRIIEVQSQQALAEYIQQNIFEPLGMHDTGFSIPPEKLDRAAVVYRREKGALVEYCRYDPSWQVRMTMPDGGLFSTPGDMAKFARAFLLDGVPIMSSDSVAKMLSPQGDVYGLGWILDRPGQFSHWGSSGTTMWADQDSGEVGVLFAQVQDRDALAKLHERVRETISENHQ